jgi:hypothetical protein
VSGENPPNHILVDRNIESQRYLLSNARTAPGWIMLLHLDNCGDVFMAGSFGTWFLP